MPKHAVINLNNLDPILILGPERYDPRRYQENENLTTIAEIAQITRDQIFPGKGSEKICYLILDTSDVQEGIIMTSKEPVTIKEIGSAKKIIRYGDVIISRLRPYLHQVAYVDIKLVESMKGIVLACSTEFFVLRSNNARSIAFLVPYLLSPSIQEILSASQEGGHHPRFNQKTLETIPLPDQLISDREYISATFESAINSIRQADLNIRMLISRCAEINKTRPKAQQDMEGSKI